MRLSASATCFAASRSRCRNDEEPSPTTASLSARRASPFSQRASFCHSQMAGLRAVNRGASRGAGRCAARAVASAAVEMPANLKRIVTAFQAVPDPMQRYKQLLFFASKLKPLPAELHIPENKVEGCVSQVWVVPDITDGKVFFRADSDSQLTKGLAALLVEGLSGATPEEILKLTPDFIELLGLKQSLTPSRNNGFLNMLRLMQKKTLAATSASPTSSVASSAAPAAAPAAAAEPAAAAAKAATARERMKAALMAGLQPAALELVDESSQHAGHSGAKGLRSGETHFKLKVVAAAFDGKSAVQRHRLVNALLQAEFDSGLHALSIDAKTPAEVEASAK